MPENVNYDALMEAASEAAQDVQDEAENGRQQRERAQARERARQAVETPVRAETKQLSTQVEEANGSLREFRSIIAPYKNQLRDLGAMEQFQQAFDNIAAQARFAHPTRIERAINVAKVEFDKNLPPHPTLAEDLNKALQPAIARILQA